MKKNKRIKLLILGVAVVLVALLSFVGIKCFKNDDNNNLNEENNSKNNNSERQVINITSSPDMMYNIADNKVLAEHSEYIALIKIESIDGVTNVNKKTGTYVLNPYSYGKAKVISVIKGTISTDYIGFTRVGGEMPYDEWIKGDIDPKKIESVRKQFGTDKVSTKNTVVKFKVENDVDIESGKVYLVFMTQNLDFNESDEYIIQGLQYGLREVQMEKVNVKSLTETKSLESLKVKNNETGKWENLTSVVDLKK